jgi:hypothetical protein
MEVIIRKWRCKVKRIVVLIFVLMLPGLDSFGLTNAAPPTARSQARPQGQTTVSKSKTADAAPVHPQGALSRSTEAKSADLAAVRRISKEGLLAPRKSEVDYGAMLERIFRSENDQMGETSVRDTIVTIFPTGR